jgi:hypothetical protein
MHVEGLLSATSFSVPLGVSNADVSASAAIAASKLIHHFPVTAQVSASTVNPVASTGMVHIAKEAGSVLRFEGIVEVIASSTSNTVTVDLLKSTAGSTYATVLSTGIVFASTSSARVPVTGTVSGSTYVDGDSFKYSVAVVGSTATQATGLAITGWFQEAPGA